MTDAVSESWPRVDHSGVPGRPGSDVPAVVHVDLDGAAEIFRGHGVPNPFGEGSDPIFESGMRHLLELLDRNRIRATLFAITSSVEKPVHRELLALAVRAGHEIASHTRTHSYLTGLDREDKRMEIATSRDQMEDALGVRVRGFRAPGYRIDRESLELLAECGYEYDSSVFPTRAFSQRIGVPVDMLAGPHRPVAGSALVELPLPDHRPSPVPFNPSYGLFLGMPYFRWGLRRAARRGRPLVLLFHLIDLADPLPADRLPGWKMRLFTLSGMSGEAKRRSCQEMLDLTRQHFRLTTTASLLQELASAGVPTI